MNTKGKRIILNDIKTFFNNKSEEKIKNFFDELKKENEACPTSPMAEDFLNQMSKNKESPLNPLNLVISELSKERVNLLIGNLTRPIYRKLKKALPNVKVFEQNYKWVGLTFICQSEEERGPEYYLMDEKRIFYEDYVNKFYLHISSERSCDHEAVPQYIGEADYMNEFNIITNRNKLAKIIVF